MNATFNRLLTVALSASALVGMIGTPVAQAATYNSCYPGGTDQCSDPMTIEQIQAENWSPSGEAQPIISGMGLGHTSMSIGDVIENFDAQTAWMVADFGFTRLPQ